MKLRYLAVLGLAASLAGCNTISQTFQLITSASVSSQYAAAEVNTFNAIEQLATGYLQLPACPPATPAGVVCRTPQVVKVIVPAVRTGRIARNQIQTAIATANGGPIPVASYNTLASVITTLQGLYTEYGIK